MSAYRGKYAGMILRPDLNHFPPLPVVWCADQLDGSLLAAFLVPCRFLLLYVGRICCLPRVFVLQALVSWLSLASEAFSDCCHSLPTS